jgi:hypothetical protein
MRRLIQATGIRTGHGSTNLAISAETGAGNFAFPGNAPPAFPGLGPRLGRRPVGTQRKTGARRASLTVRDGVSGAELRPGARHLFFGWVAWKVTKRYVRRKLP